LPHSTRCRSPTSIATVEKRDRPDLANRPVIIGEHGVVLASRYVARPYGVRSAMPMFGARAACPDALVTRPDTAKYRAIGSRVRAVMLRPTPPVEPLSIDDGFLDLRDTQELHGTCPAQLLAALA
jgi:DNA polymerase-4